MHALWPVLVLSKIINGSQTHGWNQLCFRLIHWRFIGYGDKSRFCVLSLDKLHDDLFTEHQPNHNVILIPARGVESSGMWPTLYLNILVRQLWNILIHIRKGVFLTSEGCQYLYLEIENNKLSTYRKHSIIEKYNSV